jgi:peptide/nickel transport system permease protein
VGIIIRRLITLPFLLLIVVTIAFLIFHALPGDPARAIAGPYGDAETVAKIRDQLGLGKPLTTEYGAFIRGLLHGDLGVSYFSNQPIVTEIGQRLPGTVVLIVTGVVFGLIWGGILGSVSAYYRDRMPDRLSRAIVGLQLSAPDFVIGLVLLYVLAYRLHLFPQGVGQLSLGASPPRGVTGAYVIDALLTGQLTTFGDASAHLILPSIAEGALLASIYARVIRSKLISVLQGPQVEFARACGLGEHTIWRYAAMEIRGSLLTYTALMLGALLGSDAVVETVFNWNGIAQWGVQSISQLDIPAMQGFIVLTGTVTIVIYLILDVCVLLLDPRLRRE